jgi:hypothetical protein
MMGAVHDWESYVLTAPIPERSVTSAMRERVAEGQRPCVILLQWIVDDVPVLVGRAGGSFNGQLTTTVAMLSRGELQKATFTEVGAATADALMWLDLPWVGDQSLYIVEIETDQKPPKGYMQERLARIWDNLKPKRWNRLLMIGDMSNKLDGVVIGAMNVVGTKTLADVRREMAAS